MTPALFDAHRYAWYACTIRGGRETRPLDAFGLAAVSSTPQLVPMPSIIIIHAVGDVGGDVGDDVGDVGGDVGGGDGGGDSDATILTR